MNNRRGFYDDSIWKRFENRIKTWIYGLTHELLQNQVCSSFLYKILILVETIQLLYYSIHPNLTFLFKTVQLDYFRDALKYFQVNYILFNGGVSVIVMYIAFGVQILMLFLLIIISFKLQNNKRRPSTFLIYSLKIFSLYGVLLNTILTIPSFNAFMAVIYCNANAPFSSGLDCYQGLHFLHLSLAVQHIFKQIIGLILFLINVLYFALLYTELNPSSAIPFASPQSKTPLLRQFIKIVLPLYVTLDYDANIAKVYVSLLSAFYLLLLIQRYRSPPYYNKSVQGFIVVEEVILFWSTLVDVITAFLDLQGVFYMILGMPMLSVIYNRLLSFRQWQLLQTPIKSFKKETDIEIYVNHLMDLIENREALQQRITLEGVLKLHLKNCGKAGENCVCQALVADNLKDEETLQKLKRWYQLIKSIISDALDRYPKCPRLHLLNAYIHHEKLKNEFKALLELMITEDNRPNLQEEFSIYRYKNLIEEQMIDNDISLFENRGVDVNIIVIFEKKFDNFLVKIKKSVSLHMEFWRELLDEKPNIKKLQQLISQIINTVESTNEFYKKLQEMNQNDIKCLQVYGNFLKDIVNDDVEGQGFLEKAKYITKITEINKIRLDQQKQKYGENANTCIITCSGNYNNIGTLTNTNNEITRILGFSKSDVIGQNVNRIMPKVYADQHDQFMKKYLETSESKVIGQERILFAQNKNNYLVPCTLMIKVLPNLEEGIQIVGFLKDIEISSSYLSDEEDIYREWHFIIININTQVLLGITQSCYTEFGIPASLLYSNSTNTNQFTIDAIAPELVDIKNQDDLKQQGLVTTIDTTQLQKNFLLGREESDEEISIKEEENIYESPQQVSNIQSNVEDSSLGQMFNQNQQQKETTVDISQYQVKVETQKQGQVKSKNLQKQQRYKKYKVKAFVQDETEFGDQKIQIIRFYEVMDENEMIEKQRSIEPTEEDAQQNQMKTVIKDEQQVEEDVNNSDGESKVQKGNDEEEAEGEQNDIYESRRTFVQFLQESRNVNQTSMICFKWSAAILIICLGVLGLLDYILTQKLFQDIQQGYIMMEDSNQRVALGQRIQWQIMELCRLNMIKALDTDTKVVSQKKNMQTTIQDLKDIQSTIQSWTDVSGTQDELMTTNSIKMTSRDSSGNESNQLVDINQGTSQIISKAFEVMNYDITQYDTEADSIYFIRYNLLNDYYAATLQSADLYTNQLISLANDSNVLLILLIVACVFTVISIPWIACAFNLVSQNQEEVIKLFLEIPLARVKQLFAKCEAFSHTLQIGEEEDANQENELSFEENEEGEGIVEEFGRRKKRKKYKYDSKDKRNFYIKFIISMGLLIAYFIAHYLIGANLQGSMQQLVQEMNATAMAVPSITFANNVFRQMLWDSTFPVKNLVSSDVSANFVRDLYNLNTNMQKDHSLNLGYHNTIYNNYFDSLMQAGACSVVIQVADVDLATCQAFVKGIVDESLALALSRHFENLRYVLTVYSSLLADSTTSISGTLYNFTSDSTKNKILSLMFTEIAATEMNQMQDIYIRPIFQQLLVTYNTSMQKDLDTNNTINAFILIVFFAVLVLVYLLFWQPTAKKINNELQRKKLFLSMIPLNLIKSIQPIHSYLNKIRKVDK